MIERHANAGIRRIEIKIFDDGSEEYKYFEEDIYINPSYLSNKIKETGACISAYGHGPNVLYDSHLRKNGSHIKWHIYYHQSELITESLQKFSSHHISNMNNRNILPEDYERVFFSLLKKLRSSKLDLLC